MSTVLKSSAEETSAGTPTNPAAPKRGLGSRMRRLNVPAGLGGWIWLAIIIIPVYYVVITSLKTQAGYFGQNPLALPTEPTLKTTRWSSRPTSRSTS